jgi:hypothetical protein
VANKSSENVAKFKYIDGNKPNCTDEEINSKLNSGSFYYHDVKNLFSS